MLIFMTYFPVWKEAFILAWPVILNHIFTTAMRTTDMILMGFFGPAAVTAVGLGDVWERIILRIGLGLGTGSISLISQETGTKTEQARKNADEILSQVIFASIIIGIPFILIGWLIPDTLIRVLGAAPKVVKLGAQYLLIIFSAAPFRIISIIAARAMQGTGDTKTPMVVEIIGNIINIALSIVLALGLGPFPNYGVLGVGIGTFTAKLVSALIYVLIFLSKKSRFNLQMPSKDWDLTIIRQLFKVSMPKILQGIYQSLITFPFNSLVLVFGTEAAAAYHISRRIHQQLIAPLHRSYYTVTTIMGGQKLGAGQPEESKKTTRGMLWLTVFTIGSFAVVLFFTAPWLIRIFTDDTATISFGIRFLKALSIGAPILTIYGVFAGMLNGAGNTKTALFGNLFSQTTFKLGLSYLLSIIFNLGLIGILIGLVIDFTVRALWVGKKYLKGDWVDEADKMIEERRIKNKGV
ncbi:MAG TPA: MATE family efflux transporter [Halanaerobiales bacterium]|nr:MATE family efflux transporter [Halanaerobiales bacterium]